MRLPLLAFAGALASAMFVSASPGANPVLASIVATESIAAPIQARAPTAQLDEDGLRALAKADFKQNTQNGMWFVEFFSPWCPHCKRFMPTWKDLTEISAHLEDSSQFYMGRVDCTLQGDVCDMEGIKGYPSMHLYEDGKLVSEYTGSRKFSVLKAWISGKAQDYRRRTVAAAGQA